MKSGEAEGDLEADGERFTGVSGEAVECWGDSEDIGGGEVDDLRVGEVWEYSGADRDVAADEPVAGVGCEGVVAESRDRGLGFGVGVPAGVGPGGRDGAGGGSAGGGVRDRLMEELRAEFETYKSAGTMRQAEARWSMSRSGLVGRLSEVLASGRYPGEEGRLGHWCDELFGIGGRTAERMLRYSKFVRSLREWGAVDDEMPSGFGEVDRICRAAGSSGGGLELWRQAIETCRRDGGRILKVEGTGVAVRRIAEAEIRRRKALTDGRMGRDEAYRRVSRVNGKFASDAAGGSFKVFGGGDDEWEELARGADGDGKQGGIVKLIRLIRAGEMWRAADRKVDEQRQYRDLFGVAIGSLGRRGFERWDRLRGEVSGLRGVKASIGAAFAETLGAIAAGRGKARVIGQCEREVLNRLLEAERTLEGHRAVFECPDCLAAGQVMATCLLCGGEGWLTEYEARRMNAGQWEYLMDRRLEGVEDAEAAAKLKLEMETKAARICG